jgi:hypothetical protein
MFVPANSEAPKAEGPAPKPAHEEASFARTEKETLTHMMERLANMQENMQERFARMDECIDRMNRDIGLIRWTAESILAGHLVPDLVHCVRLISYHFTVEYKKELRDLATTPSIAEVAEQARKDPASLVGVAFAAFSDSPEFAGFKDEAMINLVKAVDRVCVGKTYSSNRLLRLLSEDVSYCARLLKSRLPDHDEAIDKLLAMISALRTSVMSSKPPWRRDDDETDSYSD